MRDGKILLLAVSALILSVPGAKAGLDLQNQQEIYIPDMDLDQNGRLLREEMITYLFYYFDYDGNESLSQGEYYAERPLRVLEYDPALLEMIDFDGDKQDDGVTYTTDSFLQKVMLGEHEPGAEEIEAQDLMDIGFLRMDVDKSKYIELKEWKKHYQKHAVRKPNQAPKAADQDRYGR